MDLNSADIDDETNYTSDTPMKVYQDGTENRLNNLLVFFYLSRTLAFSRRPSAERKCS